MNLIKYFVWIIALAILGTASSILAQLPAFPGAEGFGSTTTHGRGGQVIEITNLKDSGSGSLRAAVSKTGPRIIIFRVGGLIELNTKLDISEPYCYVAGQTAPGDGICLSRARLNVSTHDVVVRFIRSRPGDDPVGQKPDSRDGFSVANSEDPPYNIVFDHCSASWAIDENAQTWYTCNDITYQWCIFSEALHNSIHPKGTHSCGLLVGNEAYNISVHHNLFAHNVDRNPLLKADTYTDVVNNVIYNWKNSAVALSDYENTNQPIFTNIVCNYFKKGPSTSNSWEVRIPRNLIEDSKLYLQGNIGSHRPTDTGNEWTVVDRGEKTYRSDVRHLAPVVTTWSAGEAYDNVLNNAGASLPMRDSVDTRIVKEVRDGTGNIIDAVSETPGYPMYKSGIPPTDSDNDGMPDSFELNNTNPPSETALNSGDTAPSGYTWIEEYVNSLVPCFTCDPTNVLQVNSGRGPLCYELHQNYPNPFNPSTNIKYSLSGADHVSLDVYSIKGAKVTVLMNGFQTAGEYRCVWDGLDSNGRLLPSGVYFCRLQAGSHVVAIKMMLLR